MRIKGEWVGKVVIKYDYEDNGDEFAFNRWKDYMKNGEMAESMEGKISQYFVNRDGTVTITQINADLHKES